MFFVVVVFTLPETTDGKKLWCNTTPLIILVCMVSHTLHFVHPLTHETTNYVDSLCSWAYRQTKQDIGTHN